MFGGGNMFENSRAATTLGASKPLPERLLLFFSLRPVQERVRSARGDAQILQLVWLISGAAGVLADA